MSLIAYVTVIYHNVSIFLIIHSQYMTKYYFYMWTASMMNYQYLALYPHANTTLTNIVYLCFSLYQLTHYLFKFCMQFEQMLTMLQAGNLAAMLSANVQNALQQVHVRNFMRERNFNLPEQ